MEVLTQQQHGAVIVVSMLGQRRRYRDLPDW